MFGERLKMFRKRKGISQEELADRLHVARQTVSKWENGTSVPDAIMLVKISEQLDVSVSELLGAHVENKEDTDTISDKLASINENLAIRNRRIHIIIKAVIGFVLAVIILVAVLYTLLVVKPNNTTAEPSVTSNSYILTDD